MCYKLDKTEFILTTLLQCFGGNDPVNYNKKNNNIYINYLQHYINIYSF